MNFPGQKDVSCLTKRVYVHPAQWVKTDPHQTTQSGTWWFQDTKNKVKIPQAFKEETKNNPGQRMRIRKAQTSPEQEWKQAVDRVSRELSKWGSNKDILIPAQFPKVNLMGTLAQGNTGTDLKRIIEKEENMGHREQKIQPRREAKRGKGNPKVRAVHQTEHNQSWG